jgi:ATP adenylyltransferase
VEIFAPGELWPRVQQVTAGALASGHLWPIPTAKRSIDDGGIEFLVRVVQGRFDKPEGLKATDRAVERNPFLPYDPELFVADISPTHVALLNKFVVVEHHLLMVTRDFCAQTDPAQDEDFDAVARCLWEYPSIAFYNAGKTAGASQPHRHWQLIPLPLHEQLRGTPIDGKLPLERAPAGRVISVAELPFRNDWWKFVPTAADSIEQFADECQRAYTALVAAAGWSRVTAETPYNLLITRQWMMLVPRREECFAGISFNAMAFLGAILVRDEDQFRQLATAGPCRALTHAAP